MKRRLISCLALLLILAQILLLVACSDPTPTDPPAQDPPAASPPPEDPPAAALPDEIKNIILIIGDGMGIEHIAAGELVAGKDYGFTGWQQTAVNTDSTLSSGTGLVLTDSAAAGTALATGKLTVNNYIGKDYTGADITTILDLALLKNKSTGIVTTDALHGATPAAFSAHHTNRNASAEIVASQLGSGVHLLCGTTNSVCTSQKTAIENAGYTYCDDFSTVDTTFSANKTYWQFDLAGANPTVSLSNATRKALDYLNRDEDGFVLMIEQAYIDKLSHNNDFAGMTACMNSLNDTVETILSWLGDRTDTAILVTADHETGGLDVSTEPIFATGHAVGETVIYYQWTETIHTNDKVGLFVYGIDVDFSKFVFYGAQHLIKNTDVYELMKQLLNDPVQ